MEWESSFCGQVKLPPNSHHNNQHNHLWHAGDHTVERRGGQQRQLLHREGRKSVIPTFPHTRGREETPFHCWSSYWMEVGWWLMPIYIFFFLLVIRNVLEYGKMLKYWTGHHMKMSKSQCFLAFFWYPKNGTSGAQNLTPDLESVTKTDSKTGFRFEFW